MEINRLAWGKAERGKGMKWKSVQVLTAIVAASLAAAGTGVPVAASEVSSEIVAEAAEDNAFDAGEEKVYQNFKYRLDNGDIQISGLVDNTVKEINIPDTIDGRSVTSIGNGAFDGAGLRDWSFRGRLNLCRPVGEQT